MSTPHLSVMRKRRRTDKRIVAAWNMFEAIEPDISTERLIEQVAQRCHVDSARVVEGLARLGEIKPAGQPNSHHENKKH